MNNDETDEFLHAGNCCLLSLCSPHINPRKVSLIDQYSSGTSLLDVGCGNGLYPLKTAHNFSRVLQVDVIDRRAQDAKKLPFQSLDAARIDTLEMTFSTVLIFDIIEHLDNDLDFLRRLRSVCEGVVIGSVPGDDDSQLQRVGLTFVHHTDKTHKRNYNPATIRQVLEKAGFTEVLVMPQYADGLIAAAYALRTESVQSRVCARLVTGLCRLLTWAGIFHNRSVADWFFVAR